MRSRDTSLAGDGCNGRTPRPGLRPGFMRAGRTRAIDGPAGCVPSFPEGAGDRAAVTARARFRPFIGLVSCEKVGQSSRRCSATLGYELTSGAALGWKCRWRSAPRRACRGIWSVIRSRTCRFSKLAVVTNAFGHGVGLVVEEAAPAGE